MAGVILSTVGGAFGGPIGAAVGGLIGSYIDSTFILPQLIDKPGIKPPKLGDLNIQTVEEGAAANYVIGPEVRVTGSIRWTSDFIVEELTSEVGGKGGGDEVVDGHAIYIDAAFLISYNEIDSVKKIWAEGKVIYDSDPDKTVVSASISAQRHSLTQMDFVSPAGGPQLGNFRTGLDLVVSGFTDTNLNGTFRVLAAGKKADGSSRVRVHNLLGFDEAALNTITLYQDIPEYNREKIQGITFYKGTTTQNPDPLIESYEGSGEVPAWRGTSYVVFQRLLLNDYGNRIPQLSFLVKESSAPMTSGSAISKVVARSRESAPTVDVSGATRTVLGYPLRGLIPTAQAVQPLQVALNVLDQETNSGTVKFFDRENATIIDIPAEDLGAFESEGEQKGAIEALPEPPSEAPSELHVSYFDKAADYQTGSQRQVNRTARHYKAEKFDFPLVLDGAGAEARKQARILMGLLDQNRYRYRLPLPPKYSFLLENDVIRVPRNGKLLTLLIERIDLGDNFMLELETTLEKIETLDQYGVADDPSTVENTVKTPPNVAIIYVDAPYGGAPVPAPAPGPVPTGGGRKPGYGIAVVPTDDEDYWPGAAVFEKSTTDEADDFIRLMTVTNRATAGYALSALAEGQVGVFDRENTVDVYLYFGTLESRTEDEVLRGFNRALIGDEVIGFTTATLTDDNTYTLSGLLRGLRDTGPDMDSHAVEENFILLNQSGIYPVEITPARIGRDFQLKAAAIGMDVDDVDAVTVTAEAKNLRPFSPANVEATTSESDTVITWDRRTREHVRLFGGSKPIGEEYERYEVDIAEEGGPVVRTAVVDDATTWTYTNSMQVDDGTEGDSVDITVYQISDVFGRGRGTTITY